MEDGDVWSNQTVADVGKVLKLLSQQESTVEDDEKFREAEQAYVLLGTLAEEMVQAASYVQEGSQEIKKQTHLFFRDIHCILKCHEKSSIA